MNKEPRKETKVDLTVGKRGEMESQERRQRQTVAESAGLSYLVTCFYEQNITRKLCT